MPSDYIIPLKVSRLCSRGRRSKRQRACRVRRVCRAVRCQHLTLDRKVPLKRALETNHCAGPKYERCVKNGLRASTPCNVVSVESCLVASHVKLRGLEIRELLFGKRGNTSAWGSDVNTGISY